MNKSISLSILSLLLFSQCSSPEKSIWISGQITNANSNELYFLDYPGDTLTTVEPDETGKFSIELENANDGFYQLKYGKDYGSRASLFLRQGDSLAVNFDASNFNKTITYSGGGADRNNYLALQLKPAFNWYNNFYNNLSAEERDKKGSMQSYFIEHHVNTLKQRLAETVTDQEFQEIVARDLDLEIGRRVMMDRYGYETDPETSPIVLNALEEAMSIAIDDYELYNSSKSYLSLVAFRLFAQDQLTENQITEIYDAISAQGLRQHFTSELALAAQKQLQYGHDAYDKALALRFFSESRGLNFAETILGLYDKFHEAEGKLSSFVYPDKNGRMVNLEEFKGSYVYIDFWATWCGPCIKEFPELKKVKEAYSDKGIKFIGISIDVPERKERWKKMIADRSLPGIQLHAPMEGYVDKDDINDEFLELLYVNSWNLGIPQFTLVDPEGRILDAFTYRPSNAKLTQLFDKLLDSSSDD